MFVVRIGDPFTMVNGGHTYSIRYRVEGGLSYPVGEGTELYWNVTGNEWEVPMRTVRATLRDDGGLFRSVRSCYRGTLGSTSGSCMTTVNDDGSITFRTTELYGGEGMTIAQSLDTVKVARDARERTNFSWFIIPLLGMGLLYGGIRFYRYKTAFKTGNTIIAEYEPYPEVKPMYTGLLLDGRLDSADITACIVYLAEQGYLKIRKTERKVLFVFEVDDYEISLTKLPDEKVSTFEKSILELLLNVPLTLGKTISLGDLKRSTTEQRENYKELLALQSELDDDLIKTGFFESGFMKLVRRRTTKGYEALDHLLGFKLFLEMTDRDRFAFHNAPEKSPEQFMEYLPYAIAFGVEKEWAKVFEGIAIPNPGWYDGGSASAFSATNLTSSLGAFSTAFAASSGTSASSGGGSSGGGAGGGGGGSW
jgi:uncharacterized membrane protein YgcG